MSSSISSSLHFDILTQQGLKLITARWHCTAGWMHFEVAWALEVKVLGRVASNHKAVVLNAFSCFSLTPFNLFSVQWPGDPGKTSVGQISPLPQTLPNLPSHSVPNSCYFGLTQAVCPRNFLTVPQTHQACSCLEMLVVPAIFLEWSFPSYVIMFSLRSLTAFGEAILDHPILNHKLLPRFPFGIPSSLFLCYFSP